VNASYKLLGVLLSEAPDAAAQDVCTRMYNDAIAEGNTEHQMKCIMSTALVDGYRSGNWPWIETRAFTPKYPAEMQPLHHSCPTCGVGRGATCRRPSGSRMRTLQGEFHAERKALVTN
jgi:hypothetical protein